MTALLIIAIPIIAIISVLFVLFMINNIKKTKLNNQIRNVIYAELVSRAPEKTAKELQEYMKIIKKG